MCADSFFPPPRHHQTPLRRRPLISRRRRFLGRLQRTFRRAANDQKSSPEGCRWWRQKRSSPRKAVCFTSVPAMESDQSTIPSTDMCTTPPASRVRKNGHQADPPNYPSSRRTFYTAISSPSRLSPPEHPSSSISEEANLALACVCGYPQHMQYSPELPILTPSGVVPNSYEELLIQAQKILGTWVTILERSESLEAHMAYLGINKMKRMVMNRLAVPFTAVLEDNDTLLHAWITTPAGYKHTRASLVGKETFDQDCDLGDWTALTSIVDFTIDSFCQSRPVRAMRMTRTNPKLGLCYETRVVLPDKEEGKILFYNFVLHPPESSGQGMLCVNRVFRRA